MLNHEQHPSCARIAQHVGEILLLARTDKGFTQAYVAEKVGLKRASSIARFEQGKTIPHLDTLIRLTLLLRIDPNDYFLGLVIPRENDSPADQPPLSLEELRTLVEPFQDPSIRRVVSQNLDQLDDPDAASFVETLIEKTSDQQT